MQIPDAADEHDAMTTSDNEEDVTDVTEDTEDNAADSNDTVEGTDDAAEDAAK